MKSKEIDVSVIYVNYKTSFLLEESIKSLLEFSICFTYEIIIVDNSCSDEERIKLIDISNRYNVRLIVLPENNGFGCANNEASKIASGKYLYFLNCDTKLISNACFELFSFLKNNQSFGVAGSNLYSANLLPAFSFKTYEINLQNEKKYDSLFGTFKKSSCFNDSSSFVELDGYVSGASLMCRKDIFFKVGGFPKEIFLYSEEVFLCYKIKHCLNLKIANVPSSKIIHLDGASFNSFSRNRIINSCNGNYQYYLLLFGENTALSYLKHKIYIYKRNSLISFMLFQYAKSKKFRWFYKAYKIKYKQVKK